MFVEVIKILSVRMIMLSAENYEFYCGMYSVRCWHFVHSVSTCLCPKEYILTGGDSIYIKLWYAFA